MNLPLGPGLVLPQGPVQTKDYPALGFDPAPGTVGKVSALAENLGKVAAEIGQAHDTLDRIGRSGGVWEGEAAQRFHEKVGPLPDYLDKANRSLGDASKVLAQWSADLSSMQTTANSHEAEAAQALDRVRQASANPDLDLVDRIFPDDGSLQQAQARYDAAAAEVKAAEAELAAIRAQAQRLLAQHEELAGQIADALERAKDEAPEEPGFFERLGEGLAKLGEAVKDLASKTWQFIEDHADLIKKIGDVLSTVGTVLSVAAVACAPIPIVGEVVAAAALGVNGAALGAHALAKAAGANVGWGTLAFDAVGMIQGGGAVKGALGGAKAAPRLIRAVVKGSGGAKGAVETISEGGGAAGKVVQRLSRDQFAGWVKHANVVGKLVKAPAIEVGTTAGRVAGTVVGTVEKGAVTVGTWVGEPYIDRGKEAAGDYYDKLSGGQQPPSAGQVFNQVVHGRAAV